MPCAILTFIGGMIAFAYLDYRLKKRVYRCDSCGIEVYLPKNYPDRNEYHHECRKNKNIYMTAKEITHED